MTDHFPGTDHERGKILERVLHLFRLVLILQINIREDAICRVRPFSGQPCTPRKWGKKEKKTLPIPIPRVGVPILDPRGPSNPSPAFPTRAGAARPSHVLLASTVFIRLYTSLSPPLLKLIRMTSGVGGGAGAAVAVPPEAERFPPHISHVERRGWLRYVHLGHATCCAAGSDVG